MSQLRSTPFTLVLLTLAAAPATAIADGGDATRVISPAHPWARVVEGELSKSTFEQTYGAEAEAARQQFEAFTQDGNVYDRDSGSAAMFKQLGLPPLHAENYEATVGVLFVQLDGVTLQPTCGNGDTANAARDCSPLVDSPTTFPAVGEPQASSIFQELQSYYQPFNVVMSANRPPEYLPYTMAVVGGSSGLVPGLSGACGVANVACDGLKRNHVSLTFPQSCGGSANTAAQETAHNWGLEHTDNAQDLMYPFNMGGSQQFVDSCMTISHATGDGLTQCDYIHEAYCPAGGGEQQNSYGELMGVFGPRAVDTISPEIVEISPPNGSVFSVDDQFLVTAAIDDDSRMVGVRWSWIEGLPPDTESYTKCTNNVCDADFNAGVSFDPAEIPWDFVSLNQPPEGTYTFLLEVIDAYGNFDSQEVTYTVTLDGSEGGDGVADAGDAADDAADDGTAGGDGGTAGDGADDGDGDGDGSDGTGLGADGGMDGGDPKGCACTVTPDDSPTLPWRQGAAMFGFIVLVAGRRRR